MQTCGSGALRRILTAAPPLACKSPLYAADRFDDSTTLVGVGGVLPCTTGRAALGGASGKGQPCAPHFMYPSGWLFPERCTRSSGPAGYSIWHNQLRCCGLGGSQGVYGGSSLAERSESLLRQRKPAGPAGNGAALPFRTRGPSASQRPLARVVPRRPAVVAAPRTGG
jgi:hypothetical protein